MKAIAANHWFLARFHADPFEQAIDMPEELAAECSQKPSVFSRLAMRY